MPILTTIVPIFTIITIGWLARLKGFMKPEFLGPANRLVYYLAIPAMIFRSIAKASLKTQFNLSVLGITLLSVVAVFAIAWGVGILRRVERRKLGTFVQSSFHGNLGYIGLAVAYYFLGTDGLVRAGILAGFIMILQNFLAVVVLQINADDSPANRGKMIVAWKVLGNPVILSAMAGILFSVSGATMPVVINRSLDILSGLALPMALLIIGASLSFDLMRLRLFSLLSSGLMKLLLLPGLGFAFYRLYGLAAQDYLPGLILLASPTATITYVMAKEMNADADFAVATISTSTLLSAITFSVWLNIAG